MLLKNQHYQMNLNYQRNRKNRLFLRYLRLQIGHYFLLLQLYHLNLSCLRYPKSVIDLKNLLDRLFRLNQKNRKCLK